MVKGTTKHIIYLILTPKLAYYYIKIITFMIKIIIAAQVIIYSRHFKYVYHLVLTLTLPPLFDIIGFTLKAPSYSL